MSKRITYDLLSHERADFVVNSLLFAMDEGAGAEVDGSRVKLTPRQVRLLAALSEDDDGHIDTDGRMWIGGTEFPPDRPTGAPKGIRCTASGQERSVSRDEWAQEVGTCPDCGGRAPFWVRATDLAPHLKIKVHNAPPGVTPAPHAYANAHWGRARREEGAVSRSPKGQATEPLSGLRLTTRQIPTTGLVLPAPDGNGEVFVTYETLEALAAVTAMDLAFFGGAPADAWVGHAAGQALVAAGLAAQSTRGSYYGTDALKAFLQEV